jgi:hypothetical protein
MVIDEVVFDLSNKLWRDIKFPLPQAVSISEFDWKGFEGGISFHPAEFHVVTKGILYGSVVLTFNAFFCS